MSHPRSNINSYSSKEYSFRSQIGSELPINENRFLSNESDPTWQSISSNNSATLPMRTTSRYQSSFNRSSNMNSTRIPAENYLITDRDSNFLERNDRIDSVLMRKSPNPHTNLAELSPKMNNRDQFSIYGSFRMRTSEKRDNSIRYESSEQAETQPMNFKNLPVKQNSTISNSLSESEVSSPFGFNSSGYFTPQIRNSNQVFRNNANNNNNDNKRNIIEEEIPVKVETQKESFSAIPELSITPVEYAAEKDEEIKKLNQTIDKLNNKMKYFKQTNEEMKKNIKDLLNERKNLIKQIENTEFEEIIEEEEVQRAKPNMAVNENQQKSFVMKEELINENYIEKNKIGLQDLPQYVLNNYRQDIIDHEREKMELEKRTLVNNLTSQHQQQLQSIKREQEVRKTQIQSYKTKNFSQTSSEVNLVRSSPSQSIATVYQPSTSSKMSQNEIKEIKKFSQVSSDIDLSRVGSFPRSIVTIVQPKTASKQSQNENIENSSSKLASETFSSISKLNSKSRTFTSKYQESVLERLANSLNTNNSELLSSLIEELLFKQTKTIGINSVPVSSNKTSQTQLNYNNISREVDIVDDKPKIETSSKSTSISPIVHHKGIQPDEKFYFETGTITDHLFYRSQGVNTINEISKSMYSPYSETDSYVTRTSSRNESKKEIKSQTVIQSSSSNLQKSLQKLHKETEIKVEPKSKDISEEMKHTTLVKDIKVSKTMPNTSFDDGKTNLNEEVIIKSQSNIQESAPKPKEIIEEKIQVVTAHVDKDRFLSKSSNQQTNLSELSSNMNSIYIQESAPKPKEIIEEWEQNIEEKVQVVTAHVDKDQNVKEDTQTTVECWETISKIKDGKLIEKKECYRDKYVSSNPDEILRHLESHSHDNHDHSHSDDLRSSEKSVKSHQHFPHNKNLIGDSTQNFIYESKRIPLNSSITESSYSKGSTNSFSIPIKKGYNEGEISKFKNYTQFGDSSTVDQHSQLSMKENLSVSNRIEQTSSSKSFNSPISFSAFSSRSSNIKSNSQQREITTSSSLSKSKDFSKPIKIQDSEAYHSKHGTSINVKTFPETLQSSGTYFDQDNDFNKESRSNNNVFYSLSELPRPPFDHQSYDYKEVLLPESIFQLSNQVLLWLNNSNHVCINNTDHLPEELIKPSIELIDWWVDMVVKLTSNQLLSTIQYIISTFNKNFLKFLIINRDQQGNTCLHYIIGHQYWESFSVLHSTGLVDPNIYNTQGFTIMMLAATLQVSDEVLSNYIRKLAVSANLNLQSKPLGQTAIYLAALHNNDNTIYTLYGLGADINIRDKVEKTPLMVAVERNNFNAAKAILTCPAVLLEIKNKEGKTALKIAEENHFTDIADLFDQRKSIRRTEMSSYSKILQGGSNPTSPITFRKFFTDN